MQQLPLLIEEIIDYYRHKGRMKRLNEEYCKKVNMINYEEHLAWKEDQLSEGIRVFLDLVDINFYIDYGIYDSFESGRLYRYITSFLRDSRKIACLPPKYVYTSGLNHPNGYKPKRIFLEE
jgi:hypothetical protein